MERADGARGPSPGGTRPSEIHEHAAGHLTAQSSLHPSKRRGVFSPEVFPLKEKKLSHRPCCPSLPASPGTVHRDSLTFFCSRDTGLFNSHPVNQYLVSCHLKPLFLHQKKMETEYSIKRERRQ